VPPGVSVTFTFQVTAVAPGAGIPTGTVQFLVDGVPTGAPATLSGGVASASFTTLAAGQHLVAAEYAGDGNFLGITNTLAQTQLVNSTPVAGPDTVDRPITNGTKVLVATLLSNDSDADGDPVQLLSVSATSTNGGTVTWSDDWIFYTPVPGFTNVDAFTYTIADSHNAQATGTVLIQVKEDVVPSPNLLLTNLGNGSYRLRFDGIPGMTYRIECTDNLLPPAWQPLGSATADPAGQFEYVDTPPPGWPERYYRSVYP
jgi:hypothetical protein